MVSDFVIEVVKSFSGCDSDIWRHTINYPVTGMIIVARYRCYNIIQAFIVQILEFIQA